MNLEVYRNGKCIGTIEDMHIEKGQIPDPDMLIDLKGTGMYMGEEKEFFFQGVTVREAINE
jgi:hypothetical protein